MDSEFGKCDIIIDERNETICPFDGVVYVLVRSPFALQTVTLCRGHQRAHREFYDSYRGRTGSGNTATRKDSNLGEPNVGNSNQPDSREERHAA